MISTKGNVKTRALALLNDVTQGAYTDAVFLEGFNEAWDALRSAFLQYQIPFIEQIVLYNVNPGTTSFSPLDAGIAGFGELVEMEERAAGSTDRFVHVWEKDKLSQRDPGEAILEFVWRLDRFEMIGVTSAREVRISYWDTGAAYPATDGESVGVDGAITFLSNFSAGSMAPRKGDYELGVLYLGKAVGARYDEGIIGGALWRLIQPMVRSRQRVPTAPKPYSVIRRRWQKRQPYIAANQPAGGGATPAIFTLFGGTITGTVDGTNPTFFLSYPVTRIVVHLNGVTLSPVQHYNAGANVVTFLDPYIPQPGADLMIEGWL